MKDNNIFLKEVGRLIFVFKKNEKKVEIADVFLNGKAKIKDIRSFPYEAEIEKARKEAYKYFGFKYSKKKFK